MFCPTLSSQRIGESVLKNTGCSAGAQTAKSLLHNALSQYYIEIHPFHQAMRVKILILDDLQESFKTTTFCVDIRF